MSGRFDRQRCHSTQDLDNAFSSVAFTRIFNQLVTMNQLNSSLPADNFIVSVLSETVPPEAMDTNPSLSNDEVSTSVGFIVLFSSFILLLCSLRRWKTPTDDRPPNFSQELKRWSDRLALDLPCRHCHYFQANRYLPCAVNPMQALTLKAIDCRDFKEKTID